MAKKEITNTDFVPHGSAQHAQMLGLVKDDKAPLGYRLADITMFGPQATQAFLDEVLRQKLATLKAPPAAPQSENPREPNYAPPMWTPES